MDADFHIELVVPNGLAVLEPLLGKAPFEMVIGADEQTGFNVLVQSKVSTVAGFFYESCSGNTHFYGSCVSGGHPGEPEEVMLQLSAIFRQAKLSHRISRIIHELNEDEEVVCYVASA
jgi:hypothetical protein